MGFSKDYIFIICKFIISKDEGYLKKEEKDEIPT